MSEQTEEQAMPHFDDRRAQQNRYDEVAVREKDLSHVDMELHEQADVVAQIQHAVDELDKRLTIILRNADDASAKVVGEPRSTLVPLAEHLHEHTVKLRWVAAQLVSMLDRLEL